jgi:hypothetical protein
VRGDDGGLGEAGCRGGALGVVMTV